MLLWHSGNATALNIIEAKTTTSEAERYENVVDAIITGGLVRSKTKQLKNIIRLNL